MKRSDLRQIIRESIFDYIKSTHSEDYLKGVTGSKARKLIKKSIALGNSDPYWFKDRKFDSDFSDAYHDAIKDLGINPENAIIIPDDGVIFWTQVLGIADRLGVKYKEIDLGKVSIIFDAAK